MAKKSKRISENTTTTVERNGIAAFISAISAKKYASAHKYLTSIVNEKIKKRINNAASKPLF